MYYFSSEEVVLGEIDSCLVFALLTIDIAFSSDHKFCISQGILLYSGSDSLIPMHEPATLPVNPYFEGAMIWCRTRTSSSRLRSAHKCQSALTLRT